MPVLTIRKLDNRIVNCLREQAAQNGVSMEEEARSILEAAVLPPKRLGDLAAAMFGPKHGVELDIPAHRPHQPLDFSE